MVRHICCTVKCRKAGGLFCRSRVLCLCQLSGSIAFGHQFFGGSFMKQPAMTMPTVMMSPCTKM